MTKETYYMTKETYYMALQSQYQAAFEESFGNLSIIHAWILQKRHSWGLRLPKTKCPVLGLMSIVDTALCWANSDAEASSFIKQARLEASQNKRQERQSRETRMSCLVLYSSATTAFLCPVSCV